MNPLDILIPAAIIGAAVLAMVRRKKARRKGCGSCCDGCAGCGAGNRERR